MKEEINYMHWQINTLVIIIKLHKEYSNTNHSVAKINQVRLSNTLRTKIRKIRKIKTAKTTEIKPTSLTNKTVIIKKCYKITIKISRTKRNKRFKNKFRNI